MKRNNLVQMGGVLAAIVVIALIFVYFSKLGGGVPEGLVPVNGRIEGTTITVAAKYPGRVHEVLVHEGDKVQAGQVMAKLEDDEVQARLRQGEAAVAAMRQQLLAAEQGLGMSKQSLPMTADAAEANYRRVQAMYEQALAAKKQMEIDLERIRRLVDKGTIQRHQLEQMQLRYVSAESQLVAAQQGVTAAKKQYDQARVAQGQVGVQSDQIGALRHQIAQTEAGLDQVRIMIDNMTIKAPANGTVVTKLIEPGELAAQGTPLFEVIDMDSLYLQAYAPEPTIGKLARGQEAQIYVDAYPDKPFPAELRYIASTAQFTPREVQTTSDRVKLVYEVKLYLKENPNGALTPGMPADGVVRWKPEVNWEKPKW